MKKSELEYEEVIAVLKEREKEIECLYFVQELIAQELPVHQLLLQIVKHISSGWQYPELAKARIVYDGNVYKEDGWDETEWMQYSDLIVDDKIYGRIELYYIRSKSFDWGQSPFLIEEQKLLNTIALKIGAYIFNRKLIASLEVLKNQNKSFIKKTKNPDGILPVKADAHWIWRLDVAKRMADKLDFQKYGVKSFYLIGSVKDATCGPGSDIDLLLHIDGDNVQQMRLREWIEGWSLGLDELNFSKTGIRSDGLIDLHLVTDDDIKNQDSFASMITSVYNRARIIKSRNHD